MKRRMQVPARPLRCGTGDRMVGHASSPPGGFRASAPSGVPWMKAGSRNRTGGSATGSPRIGVRNAWGCSGRKRSGTAHPAAARPYRRWPALAAELPANRPGCAKSGPFPIPSDRMRGFAFGCSATAMPMRGPSAAPCPSEPAGAPSRSRPCCGSAADVPEPRSRRGISGIPPEFGMCRQILGRAVLHIDRNLTDCLFVLCMQYVLFIDPRDS